MLNILIGFVSGIISGMGIGGGAILIPALVILNNVGQQTAQGINLVYFIPTAIASLFIHMKKKNVNVKTALIIGFSGAFGSTIGAIIAGFIEPFALRRIFGIFLFGVGIYEVCQIFVKKTAKNG